MSPFDQIQEQEARRDAALEALTARIPYVQFLGVRFERLGDELTARLEFDPKLIGNPILPALHGGAMGGFLEITAIMQLAWDQTWGILRRGGPEAEAIAAGRFPATPKTVDLTIDYLRSARARSAFARAQVTKQGRRVANVRVEAWQDERDRPVAAAHGHFLLPEAGDGASDPAK
ncbi:MAG: PaaI family thioesterase [Pseudomonadota bacterium]